MMQVSDFAKKRDEGSYGFGIDSINPVETANYLLVVWGESYIKMALDFCLTSANFPSNIPSITKEIPGRLIILTTKKSIIVFKKSKVIKNLSKIIQIKYIAIDDLVCNQQYAAILTLSFYRGIEFVQKNSKHNLIYLLFSDFFYSNGSLGAVYQEALKGKKAIFAPSIRVSKEKVETKLSKLIKSGKATKRNSDLSLMRMTLDNLHPTVTAMIVNQKLIAHKRFNQIYYRVNKDLLLSRHYLLHCAAFVPNKTFEYVNSYFDYGLIPELVGFDDWVCLTNSNQFIAVELQANESERELLRFGSISRKEIAKQISDWSGLFHRKTAKYLLIFSAIPQSKINFNSFEFEEFNWYFEDINNHLSLRTKNYKNHIHWVGGIQELARYLSESKGKKVLISDFRPKVSDTNTKILNWAYSKLRSLYQGLENILFNSNRIPNIFSIFYSTKSLIRAMNCSYEKSIFISNEFKSTQLKSYRKIRKFIHPSDFLALSKRSDFDCETLVMEITAHNLSELQKNLKIASKSMNFGSRILLVGNYEAISFRNISSFEFFNNLDLFNLKYLDTDYLRFGMISPFHLSIKNRLKKLFFSIQNGKYFRFLFQSVALLFVIGMHYVLNLCFLFFPSLLKTTEKDKYSVLILEVI